MTLDEVERFAFTEGVTPPAFRHFHDESLLIAISRLLQAIYCEKYLCSSNLEQQNDGSTWLVIGHNPSLRLPINTALAFHRLEATGFPDVLRDGERRTICTGFEFLQSLRLVWRDEGRVPFDRLTVDFENSLANLVLNRILFHLQPLNSQAVEPAFEGHNCYPFPGLRIGPSLNHIVKSSNLSREPVELPLATIRNHRFLSSDCEDEEAFFYRWIGATVDNWCPGLIPIHPWQLALSPVVQSCQLLGIIDVLPQSAVAMPLASQRTCRILASGYDVKLPIDATLTSERRLLYPLNFLNAPVISKLARSLLEADGPDTLEFQYDVACMAYPDDHIGSHLAAIFRSPVPQHADETVIPALLLWTQPGLAKSLFRIDDRDRAHQLFLKYCRILLRGPVEFYALWGLALEPHLQNALIRIKDSMPIGLVLRDVDATILDPDRIPRVLRENGLQLPSEHWNARPKFLEGGQRLIHALLYAHLSQVMLYLVNHAGIEVAALLRCVEEVWNELLRSHSGEPRDRIAGLRAQSGTIKRLLTMRMEQSMDLSFVRSSISQAV